MFITVFCITMAVVIIAVFLKEAVRSASDRVIDCGNRSVGFKTLHDAGPRGDGGKSVGTTIKGRRYSSNNEIEEVVFVPDTGYYFAVLKNTKTGRKNVCSETDIIRLQSDIERTFKTMAEEEDAG